MSQEGGLEHPEHSAKALLVFVFPGGAGAALAQEEHWEKQVLLSLLDFYFFFFFVIHVQHPESFIPHPSLHPHPTKLRIFTKPQQQPVLSYRL